MTSPNKAKIEYCPVVLFIRNQHMETSAEPLHLLRGMGDTLWYEVWSCVVQMIDTLFSLLRKKNR